MTRINAGIAVATLSDKHLLAEHREIKRIPNLVKRLIRDGRLSLEGKPDVFTLGKGHVKFFYDKLGYLKTRYLEIYGECINRKFNVQNYTNAWDGIDVNLFGDYEPTDEAISLLKQRINERSPNQ
jgi:deoxyribonuclease (pyrimidine dimer)